MRKLLPILIISLVMAYFSEKKSVRERDPFGNVEYVKKDWIFYLILTVIMAVFAGLRTRGNDTFAYRHMYDLLPTGWDSIKSTDWGNLASAPGFRFLNIFIKTKGFSVQDFLMLYSVFTVSVYMWFVRKYSKNILFSVFLVFTIGVYTFTMAAIKQTVAVAFLLIATDFAIRKKYIPFAMFVAVAMLFHPYAFMYLIVPFLDFIPWSRKTFFFMIGTVVIALSFNAVLGSLLDITGAFGAEYSVEEMTREGVNVFRVLVVWAPVILSFFVRNEIREKKDRTINIVVNATMINALIMFIGLFGTANYFARLANYFMIFQAIALPIILGEFGKENRTRLSFCAVIGFIGYFYYGTVLANGSFDSDYSFISLFDYFKQLR